MLSSISSTTSASFNNTNDPTLDPNAAQNPANPNDPANPGNGNDPANPNQQARPVNTANQVAALRKLEQTIAKKLKQAEATASSGSAAAQAAQAMVGALTAQINSIEAQIDHISSLDAMRQQKHPVSALQGASRGSTNAQLLKEAQKARQAESQAQKQAEQKHTLTTDDANGSNSASQKAKPFRFDFTGTIVDDMA
jgi:hypothetical protein